MASRLCLKRINKEISMYEKEKFSFPNLFLRYKDDDILTWYFLVHDLKETPFEGGIYFGKVMLDKEYPLKPLLIRFLTKIYHPNIDFLGRICMDILKNFWSPALQIQTVMLSVQSLLSTPNMDDPLNVKVALEWNENPKRAQQKAIEYVNLYAK
jgi:ubiquitin-conjugating enzyme E2 N